MFDFFKTYATFKYKWRRRGMMQRAITGALIGLGVIDVLTTFYGVSQGYVGRAKDYCCGVELPSIEKIHDLPGVTSHRFVCLGRSIQPSLAYVKCELVAFRTLF
jgi:predicted anti-sigma-YlaC factor YlaD